MTGAHSTGERFRATTALLFSTWKLSHFLASHTQWVCTLWAQFLPQFCPHFLETLQVFCKWLEYMHVVWALLSHSSYFFFIFSTLSVFVITILISTYSDLQLELPRPIPWNVVESDLGCTSRIYFDNVTFLMVWACEPNSLCFYANVCEAFACVFFIVWRYACGFDIIPTLINFWHIFSPYELFLNHNFIYFT